MTRSAPDPWPWLSWRPRPRPPPSPLPAKPAANRLRRTRRCADDLMRQAQAATAKGDTELALRLAQSAIVADPARPASYDALGDLYAAPASPISRASITTRRWASIPPMPAPTKAMAGAGPRQQPARRQRQTRPPNERSGSGFRQPGHPADRAARARGRRLLRDRALQQGRRGAGEKARAPSSCPAVPASVTEDDTPARAASGVRAWACRCWASAMAR